MCIKAVSGISILKVITSNSFYSLIPPFYHLPLPLLQPVAMPFQPPSIMAACMILLAAPKLAASMPAVGERGLMLCQRQETGEDGDELQPIVCEERPIIPTPEYTTPTGSLTPVEPAEPQVYFAYQGCYNEPKRGGRALEHVWMDDGMTPSRCEEHAAGFAYHGVEYGNECWYERLLRGHARNKSSTLTTFSPTGMATH